MAQASRRGDGQLVLVATLPSLPARLVGCSEAAELAASIFIPMPKPPMPDNPLSCYSLTLVRPLYPEAWVAYAGFKVADVNLTLFERPNLAARASSFRPPLTKKSDCSIGALAPTYREHQQALEEGLDNLRGLPEVFFQWL